MLAALLGMFVMHGLATHGTSHQAHAADPAAMASAEHHGASMALGPAVTAPRVEPAPGPQGVGVWCLAVLLVGVGLGFLFVRRRAIAQGRGRTHLVVGRPVRARRDRDPPCLFVLSVQRC